MSKKSKGINGEREVIKLLWENGWAAIRSAGSGSSHYPSPDILAGKLGRRIAIECKVTSEERKYFPSDEIKNLQYFAKHFGAEPFVAVKFVKTKWYLFTIEDLKETENGYSIKQSDCDLKGIELDLL